MKRIFLTILFLVISLFGGASNLLQNGSQKWDLTYTPTDDNTTIYQQLLVEIPKIEKQVAVVQVLMPRATRTATCNDTGCPIDSIKCDAVTEDPICPDGSVLNKVRDMCQKDPNPPLCPSGYTYDTTVMNCVKPLECPDGGTYVVSRQRCEVPFVYVCPSGYTQSPDGDYCIAPPICPSGAEFDATLLKCVVTVPEFECSSSYLTYNPATQKCESAPSCPGGVYDTTLNKCTIDFIKSCPSGYTLNSAQTRCERNPTCPSGTVYNNTNNRCEKDIVCPSGYTWDATRNTCTGNATCSYPAHLNTSTNHCEYTSSSNNCPAGTTFNTSTKICSATPTCKSPGTYDSTIHKCKTSNVSHSCPSGYSYNSSLGKCESAPSCPSGATYNTSYNKCMKSAITSCPSGYSYSSSRSRCERDPVCPSGTNYNKTQNKCVRSIPLAVSTSEYNPILTSPIKKGANNVTINFNERSAGNTGHNNNAFTCGSVVEINGKCVDYSGLSGGRGGWGWSSSVNMFGIQVPATVEGNPITKVNTNIIENNDIDGRAKLTYTLEPKIQNCANNGWLIKMYKVGTNTEVSGGYVDGSKVKVNLRCYQVSSNSNNGYFTLNGSHTDNITLKTVQGTFYLNGSLYPDPGASGYFGHVYISVDFNYYGNLPAGTCKNLDLLFQGKCYSQAVVRTRKACTDLYGTVSGSQCLINPTCPNGGSFDGNADKCWKTTTHSCPSGTTYSSSANSCISNPVCDHGGSLNTYSDKCIISATNNCTSGYWYSSYYGRCISNPNCPSGTSLSTSTNKCQKAGGYTCYSGYSINNNLCYKAPNCSNGSYNSSYDRCNAGSATSCVGLSLDTNKNKCYINSSCYSGGYYDTSADKCWFSYSPTCSKGTYSSSERKCIFDAACGIAALNPTLDVCQSADDVTCPKGTMDYTNHKCTYTATCQGDGSLVNTQCKTDKVPLQCAVGTDNSLKVCFDHSNYCQVPSTYAKASTQTYEDSLKICIVEEDPDCPSSMTWTESNAKCEAVPVCATGVYHPDNDFCFDDQYSCPIDSDIPCHGTEQFNHWCSPWTCNNEDKCGYAYCPNNQAPKTTAPWMLKSLYTTLNYTSNGQCIGAQCDVVTNRDISYCGANGCPKGFGVYERDNKCYQMSCPDDSAIGDNGKCYTLQCPSGTVDQGDGTCK